jgi:hypothetical protein
VLAFLDLAECVGLDLEVLLHLAYGSRGRRRRHGLPLFPPSSAAGFGSCWHWVVRGCGLGLPSTARLFD